VGKFLISCKLVRFSRRALFHGVSSSSSSSSSPKTDIIHLEIHIPNLITAEFLLFSKSQFTINAQNVLHMNRCAHVDMSDHGLLHPFRAARVVVNGFTNIKNVLVKFFIFN